MSEHHIVGAADTDGLLRTAYKENIYCTLILYKIIKPKS